MKLYLSATDFTGNNIAASQNGTVKIKLPSLGRLTLANLVILQNGALMTLAKMYTLLREVRVKLGTEIVRQIKAADYLAAMLPAQGSLYAPSAGLLQVYFGEPWRATVVDEITLGLDLVTRSGSTTSPRFPGGVSIELDFTNDATGVVNVQADVEVSDLLKADPVANGGGGGILGIMKHDVQTVLVGAGSPFINLDPFVGTFQRAYLVTPTGSVLSRVRLYAPNQQPLYDRTQQALYPGLALQLKPMGMLIPGSYTDDSGAVNVWPLIPDNNQLLRDAYPNPAGYQLQPTLDVGCTIRIIRETLIPR